MGVKTGFIGTVGRDAAGDYILDDMRREGVDTSGITMVGKSTGEVIALVDKKGERMLYAYPGVNDSLRINEATMRYARKAKFLHISSFVGEASYSAQKELLTRLKGTKVSFSPGMLYARKGLKSLGAIIGVSEAAFMNAEELRIMTGAELEEGASELLDLGARIIAVTLGAEGCYIKSRDEEKTVKGYPARAVDTTGAGDAFAAGFLYGLLKGHTLTQCGKLGNKLASLCIAEVGARAGLPTMMELEGFISSLR
jgi:ribokinase